MKFTTSDFGFIGGVVCSSQAAQLAQAAFDKWISEQQVVYCNKIDSPDQNKWIASELNHPIDTHKARLVCIEELAPKVCGHSDVTGNMSVGYICRKCGNRLKPNWYIIE